MLRSLATRFFLSMLALCAAIPAFAWDLPQDAQELLPDDASIVLIVPSYEQLDARWQEFAGAFDDEAPSLWEAIKAIEIEDAAVLADPTQPWVVIFHTRALFSEEDDAVASILMPLLEPDVPLESLPVLDDAPARDRRGDYVVWSPRADYEAAGKRVDMVRDLPSCLLHLAVDAEPMRENLDALVEELRAGSESTGPDGMLIELLETIVESTEEMHISLDSEGPHVDLSLDLRTRPGTPLAPGASHPSWQEAEKLGRALPGEGGIVTLSAINLQGVAEWYADWASRFLSAAASDLGDQAVDAKTMYDSIVALYSLYSEPWAGRWGMGPEGMECIGAVRVDDPEAELNRMVQAVDGLTLPGFGFVLTPIDPPPSALEGARSFELGFDMSNMPTAPGDEGAPEMMETVGSMLSMFLPPLNFFAEGDYLYFSLERGGTAAIEEMRERLRSGQGRLEPRVAEALNWAGESHSITVVDIMPFIEVVSMFVGGLDIDPDLQVRLAQTLMGSLRADRDGYELSMRVDAFAVVDLIETFKEAMPQPAPPAEEEGEWEESSIAPLDDESATRLAEGVMSKIEVLRGHEFESTVRVRVVSDQVAREHFLDRLDQFNARERLREQQEVYRDLGLIDEHTDLEEVLFEVLAEQAGGFYDPATKVMFVLDDVPAGSNSIILAHELTHALDDQLFGFDQQLMSLMEDEDRQMAYSSVVEGSGTAIMMRYMFEAMSSGDFGMEEMTAFQESEMAKSESLDAAPHVLKRGLLAPYVLGQLFLLRGQATRMAVGASPEDVDQAFRDPPLSSEQILHPEKYWDEEVRDEPAELEFQVPASLTRDGWRESSRGTLGEIDLAVLTGAQDTESDSPDILFGDRWTTSAATGWGADQWVLLRRDDTTLTLLATAWDDEDEAREFAEDSHIVKFAPVLDGTRVTLVAGEGATPEIAQELMNELRVVQ